MSVSKSKCWYSNNCLHFLKSIIPLKAAYSHHSNSNKFPEAAFFAKNLLHSYTKETIFQYLSYPSEHSWKWLGLINKDT